ncbi:MAG: glycosyltransferase family 1 protein [Candidatus Andersenbacteria bacterium]
MEIAIDVRSLMEGRHSGVQEYTSQLIQAFARVAPEHVYRLFYNAARPVQPLKLPQGVEIVGLRYPNKLFNASQWALGFPRWDSLLTADCFFVPSLRLLPLSIDMPLVTTVHDLSFEHFPEFFSWRRRLWHTLMRPRLLMQNSDHLIAVSAASADDVIDRYQIPPERVSVVYSGVKELPVGARNSIGYVRRKYHLPPQFILYFGTLEPRKNITSIITAFSAVATYFPHHLVIAGARGWLTHALDKAVAQSPAQARIHMPGFIAEADKNSLYAAADLFVYPSFYEGFGFPPLEALVAGTPVITSYNSSLPEIVGEWATLVDPYNPGELALVMKELLINPRRVDTVTRQTIQEHYSWDKAAAQTLRIIEQVS